MKDIIEKKRFINVVSAVKHLHVPVIFKGIKKDLTGKKTYEHN